VGLVADTFISASLYAVQRLGEGCSVKHGGRKKCQSDPEVGSRDLQNPFGAHRSIDGGEGSEPMLGSRLDVNH